MKVNRTLQQNYKEFRRRTNEPSGEKYFQLEGWTMYQVKCIKIQETENQMNSDSNHKV